MNYSKVLIIMPPSTPSQTLAPPPIVYPDSDGLPMAENTRQFRYIVTIQGGLDALFRHDPNVFVAGDLFWYPVEGDNRLRTAPDILVAFGRPKGDRGSYLQWLEGQVAPQVVFEVLSPGKRFGEMLKKFHFYERHGVEEYYLYDPDRGDLTGWLHSGEELREIPDMTGWVSPRLKVRFELVNGELELYGPDGQKFLTYLELTAHREAERHEKQQAQQRAAEAQQRAERLEAQLRQLGVEPEQP